MNPIREILGWLWREFWPWRSTPSPPTETPVSREETEKQRLADEQRSAVAEHLDYLVEYMIGTDTCDEDQAIKQLLYLLREYVEPHDMLKQHMPKRWHGVDFKTTLENVTVILRDVEELTIRQGLSQTQVYRSAEAASAALLLTGPGAPRRIDRQRFFALFKVQFNRRLTQSQVDGFNAIIDAWEKHYADDEPERLAYILATAWHETARTMEPVRESLRKTDEAAQKVVFNYLVGRGKSRTDPSDNYAIRHENGNAYYGRGYPQLTWPKNYILAGEKLDLPLYDNPDLMLEADVSAEVLVVGSMEGWFTGRGLPRYIKPGNADFYNARRVINHISSHPKPIARIAENFLRCLS